MGRRTLRIFLSSPGDTADERTIARGVFDTLRYDPLLRKRVELEVIAWDDPHGDTPFIATLTPQQAIDRGLPKPSECDIVVVILWSRIGTLLDSRVHGTKADGTPYLSGTEWEFYDAMNASAKTGKPIVLVYRRMEPYYLDPSASDFQEKHRQWQRVTDFFEHFTNPDGSYRQGYNEYKSSDEFQRRLEAHLKTVIGDILEQDNTANQTDPKISTREMVVWRGAPFPGLRSFEIGEGQIFFGRSSETASLIRRLGQVETRMIAVVGASGSGKSSLIKAGVIPRLRDGAISGSKNWCVSVFRPAPFGNADPFENLVTALPISKSANVTEVSGWAVRLKADSNALHDLVYTSLHDAPSWSELLIVIDQFEEVFSLANRSDLVAFIELLVTAVQTPRVRVILTLRADYYAHCLAYPRLARLLQDATFPLSAPGTEALRDMITRPAQMAGLRFENGLVERILDDTGMEPGALALMAFTLDELYRFSKKNNVLTHAVYETLGGVQGALAERAEDVFSHLAPTTKEAFPIVFRELCEVDDDSRITGRRASPSFLGQRGEVSRLADEFVKARLLTMGRNEDEKPTIEVAHEALFRSWPRLAKWIEETSDDLRLVRQLRFAAKYWDQTGRQTEELLGGSRLERAQQWLHTMQFDFDDLMREFVEASAIHQRRQYRTRNRYRVGLFIAGGLAIVMLIGFLFVQNQTQLDANIRLAASAATAVRSFDEAQSILLSNGVLDAIYRGLPDVALALAVQANQISNPPMEARRGLIEAVSHSWIRNIWYGHTDDVLAIDYSRDGQTALSGSADHDLILWDVTTGQPLRHFSGHSDSVRAVAFSPDNTNAVSASADRTLKIWDIESGEVIHTLYGHAGPVNSVAYSPDGRYILSASSDKTLILWDASEGAIIRRLEGHNGEVYCVDFSPDGQTAISGGEDKLVIVWEVATGQLLREIDGHLDSVYSVAYSPNGRVIASGSADKSAVLWDAESGELLHRLAGEPGDLTTHLGLVLALSFHPDGHSIVTANSDRSLVLWDVESGDRLRQLYRHTDWVNSVDFSPDGESVLSASSDNTIIHWDIKLEEILRRYRSVDGVVLQVAISPDGRTALSGTTGRTLRLWDIDTGRTIRELLGHVGRIFSVDFGPDGRTAISGSGDTTLIQWDLETGAPIKYFRGHTDVVQSIDVSPDGTVVLSASRDGTVILWDVASGEKIYQLEVGPGDLPCLTFNPNGSMFAACSADNSFTLWDTATGQPIRRFDGHASPVNHVAFSPDGRTVLSAALDTTLILWDISTGDIIGHMIGHRNAVWSATFSPDGQYVLSGSSDSTMILWDVATQEMLRRYIGHVGPVFGISYFQDNERAITASGDGSLILWKIEPYPDDLLSWIKDNRYLPELTCEQRRDYRVEPLCTEQDMSPTPTSDSIRPSQTVTPELGPTARPQSA